MTLRMSFFGLAISKKNLLLFLEQLSFRSLFLFKLKSNYWSFTQFLSVTSCFNLKILKYFFTFGSSCVYRRLRPSSETSSPFEELLLIDFLLLMIF